jgi:hypothetical protein
MTEVLAHQTPSLQAWDLVEGRYVERACVTGDAEATPANPVPVAVRASDLVEG